MTGRKNHLTVFAGVLSLRSAMVVFSCLVTLTAFGQDTSKTKATDKQDTSKYSQVPDIPSVAKLDFERAGEYERNSKFKLAVEYYTYCIDNSPPQSDIKKFALYRRASCYFRQKIYDLALRDAMNVPNEIIKHLFLIPAKDVVKMSLQYDHDAYIMTGLTKGLTHLGLACPDFKKAHDLENLPNYKGNKGADAFIKKYCH